MKALIPLYYKLLWLKSKDRIIVNYIQVAEVVLLLAIIAIYAMLQP